jgi:hypothetical protein
MGKVKKLTRREELKKFLRERLAQGMSRSEAAQALYMTDKKVSKGYAITLVYAYFPGDRYATSVPAKPKAKKKTATKHSASKAKSSAKRNPATKAKPPAKRTSKPRSTKAKSSSKKKAAAPKKSSTSKSKAAPRSKKGSREPKMLKEAKEEIRRGKSAPKTKPARKRGLKSLADDGEMIL